MDIIQKFLTVAVKLFGEKKFKDVIVPDLEKEENLSMFQRLLSIPDLVQLVRLRTGRKIIPGSTLLFIDEIRNFPILHFACPEWYFHRIS